MRIITLLENETNDKKLKAAHGLSLYIETHDHKILFDVGPSVATLKNANALGIDIADIDIVVISHGHNDHAGALQKFLKKNSKAKIYASSHVFEEHIKRGHGEFVNIGVKQPKVPKKRMVFVDEDIVIDDTLSVIASVPFNKSPIDDDTLQSLREGIYMDDDFRHEIYLVIEEEDTHCLISGCSHKGIEHIVSYIETMKEKPFTHIIGGYHMSQYDPFNFTQQEYLNQLAQKWNLRSNTKFFSCHCTGEEAYHELKTILRERLFRLKTGDSIII